ncbi:hypothetical protein ACQV2S_01235 [Facklamia sp. P13064]|uniref:hypothetical protein n=1 Tax=Facklamia sp. P13064 TaxID=3421953 RepID=UPI003D1669BE
MLTKEFIKKVKESNEDWDVELADKCIYIKIGRTYYCSVRTDETYAVDTRYGDFYETSETDKEKLFKLCVEYASTPIEEREDRLSDIERAILENVEGINYIARDRDNNLYAYKDKPTKDSYGWKVNNNIDDYIKLNKNLFSFIKWENQEPTEIIDLLEAD